MNLHYLGNKKKFFIEEKELLFFKQPMSSPSPQVVIYQHRYQLSYYILDRTPNCLENMLKRDLKGGKET